MLCKHVIHSFVWIPQWTGEDELHMLHRQKKVDEPKRTCLYIQATAMADANVLTACLIHLAKHGDIELSRMQEGVCKTTQVTPSNWELLGQPHPISELVLRVPVWDSRWNLPPKQKKTILHRFPIQRKRTNTPTEKIQVIPDIHIPILSYNIPVIMGDSRFSYIFIGFQTGDIHKILPRSP